MTERIIGGKYCLIRLLGEGGASEVYLARDLRMQKRWAVKKMKDRTGGRVMLLREMELLSRLDHPALPRAVDWIEEDEELCLVMDFVEGKNLEQFLKENGPADGRKICRWGLELCGVLGYLHSRRPPVLHQDLKPANLILQPDGSLKLIDLGAAARKAEEMHWGTKGYTAPERLKRGRKADERADIYSLGVTLYRLATGEMPESAGRKTAGREGGGKNSRNKEKRRDAGDRRSLRGKIPGLSGRLSAVIWKCMDALPERRFCSCVEVSQALEKCPERRAAGADCRRREGPGGLEPGRQKKRDGTFRRLSGSRLRITAFCMTVVGAAFLTILLRGTGGFLPDQKQAEWIQTGHEQAEWEQTEGQQAGHEQAGREQSEQARAKWEQEERAEAYRRVLERIGEDHCFTVREEQELLSMWEQDRILDWEQTLYQELTFRVGRLYWRWYLCGETKEGGNCLTGKKEAVPWFEEAEKAGTDTELGRAAALYAFAGNFYRELLLTVREEPEAGWYRAYWERLRRETERLAASAELPEEARLEFFRMCLLAAECWQEGFRQDGISAEELAQFRREVLESAEGVQPESAYGKEVLEAIRKEAGHV